MLFSRLYFMTCSLLNMYKSQGVESSAQLLHKSPWKLHIPSNLVHVLAHGLKMCPLHSNLAQLNTIDLSSMKTSWYLLTCGWSIGGRISQLSSSSL